MRSRRHGRAARERRLLVPDDLCLMERDGESYRLTAACVCSPSYWRLTEKIGRTLDGIHGPVPTLNDKLGVTMLQFFDRLPDGAVFERRNWLIHTSAELYHPQSDPWPTVAATDATGLVVRSERQTLRRLDPTTVVFTIRVSCHPLAEIVSYRDAARDLLTALESKDEAERSATGYRFFGPAVVAFLNSVSGGTMTDVLATFPRVDLGFLPTPLEPLDRLSTSLGGPRIWIKRDDCTGLATGGNKTRKLEFLMGDAISLGADTVITYGAVQSNHARQTAAACAKLGFECHLLLSRRVAWQHPEFETSGNVLLDRLLGAHIHFTEPANAEAASRTLINDLTLLGRHCYVIPTGGSNAIGALGYMRCAAEIVAQSRELGFKPDAIVHATSSGGTQAGLVAGLAAENFDCDVIGINVYDTDHAAIERRIEQLLAHDNVPRSSLTRQRASVANRSRLHRQGLRHPDAADHGRHQDYSRRLRESSRTLCTRQSVRWVAFDDSKEGLRVTSTTSYSSTPAELRPFRCTPPPSESDQRYE